MLFPHHKKTCKVSTGCHLTTSPNLAPSKSKSQMKRVIFAFQISSFLCLADDLFLTRTFYLFSYLRRSRIIRLVTPAFLTFREYRVFSFFSASVCKLQIYRDLYERKVISLLTPIIGECSSKRIQYDLLLITEK